MTDADWIEVGPTVAKLFAEYRRLRDIRDSLDKEMGILSADILDAVPAGGLATFNGQALGRHSTYDRATVSTTLLREKYPLIAEECLSVKTIHSLRLTK